MYRLFRCFLLCRVDIESKEYLAKWDLLYHHQRALGLGRLVSNNIASVGKWSWRCPSKLKN